VIMETEAAPTTENAANAGSPGFNFWRMISPLRGTRPDKAAADPDAEEPGTNAGQEEEPAKEKPEPDKKDFDND
jgi:hypothetical protein